PNLDDRRWADLVEEGRALIPLHAPEWTDHNLHDPGITLIELFAWLAEQDLFRVDRVGVEQVRKLLALAGATPTPPRAARVVLGVTPAPGCPTAIVPGGTQFRGTTPDGGLIRFCAAERTFVAAASVESFQVESRGKYEDRTRRAKLGEPFPLWGGDPGPGASF